MLIYKYDSNGYVLETYEVMITENDLSMIKDFIKKVVNENVVDYSKYEGTK